MCTVVAVVVCSSHYCTVVAVLFKKNLNASKPSEHPPQVEECLKV